MSLQDENKAIAQEFFDVMLTLKRSQKRLNNLAQRGEDYRSDIVGDGALGNEALANLELAADLVDQSLDQMANACGAAKRDGQITMNPFKCPAAVLHDMRASIERESEEEKAA